MPRDKPRHYKSQEGYDKSMAYIHMHNIPHEQHKFVYVAGHKHIPEHRKEKR